MTSQTKNGKPEIVTTTYGEAYRTGPANHLETIDGFIRLRIAFGRALVTYENGTEANYKPTYELTWIRR